MEYYLIQYPCGDSIPCTDGYEYVSRKDAIERARPIVEAIAKRLGRKPPTDEEILDYWMVNNWASKVDLSDNST